MKGKSTIKTLKRKLDEIFSKFIRQRNADANGYVPCFTCGNIDHWSRMDAGHFISRRYLAIRWDEINVQTQCKNCNIFKQGEQYIFGIKLREKYGENVVLNLGIKRHNKCKMDRLKYEVLIQEYQDKLSKGKQL